MLKLKYLFENYDLAKEALKNWEYDEENLDKVLTRYRISSNAIYPYFENKNLCFLRLAPIEEKLEQNIYGELEFIDYLITNGFSALKPIKTKAGKKCIVIDTKWGKYYACAFKKVNGVAIEDSDMDKNIMYEYGKTLGELHLLSAQFSPNIKKWNHIDVLDSINNVITEYNAPESVIKECNKLRSELNNIPQTKDNYGLVHYDFELDNVFYDSNTNLCSVIDFDDGMYNWYAVDLVQAFESMEDELNGEKLKIAKEKFIEGYKTKYYYEEETERLFSLMYRFVNLFSYSRLIRCVYEKFEDEPEWMVDLRKRFDYKIRNYELSLIK